MDSAADRGYQAAFSGLRTRSSEAEGRIVYLEGQQLELSRIFYEVGNPLGNDQYGATLERVHWDIKGVLSSAFDRHIGSIEHLRDGLSESSMTYESAETYGSIPEV